MNFIGYGHTGYDRQIILLKIEFKSENKQFLVYTQLSEIQSKKFSRIIITN